MRFFKGNLIDAEDNMPTIRQKTVQDIEKFKKTAPGNFKNLFPPEQSLRASSASVQPDSECHA